MSPIDYCLFPVAEYIFGKFCCLDSDALAVSSDSRLPTTVPPELLDRHKSREFNC